MRKAFLKWSETYVETFQYSRFLTQLFAFCVALCLIFNFADSIYKAYPYLSEVSGARLQNFIKDLALEISVALLFAARFSLLFFKGKIYFWLSQFVWLFTFLVLLSQYSSVGCTKNAFPMFGENLSSIFVVYLLFSPLRQLLTLLVSFGRVSDKNLK